MTEAHRTEEGVVKVKRGGRWPKLDDEEYRVYWIERVRARCTVDARGCWLWQGTLQQNGYGQTTYRSKNIILSRQMFQSWHKIALKRLEYICHTCDVKRCCNPDHLWLGSNGANVRDLTVKAKNYWANRTHCPRGHKYTSENTYIHEVRPGIMSRNCKLCARVRGRLKAGWTMEEAMAVPKIPAGYSKENRT